MTTPERTTAELIAQLTDELGRLVRQELRQAQAEMAGKAGQGARGVALLGAAGMLGAMAAGTSAATLLRQLDRMLPPRLAALVVTGTLGAAAAALGARGIAELRRIDLLPERTVSSLRADIASVAPATENRTNSA